MLTIRKISFRNIRGTQLPSRASLATQLWRQYDDNIEIPAIVLMETMESEAAQVVFISMRNIDQLLSPGQSDSVSEERQEQVVNSQVIHLAFGERSDLLRLKEPVKMTFQHKTVTNVNNPKCVLWDRDLELWSSRHCQLVFSNSSHSQCQCSRVGTYGLMEDVVPKDSMAKTTFMVMVIIAVAVSTVVLISVVLVAVYCYRIKVRTVPSIQFSSRLFQNSSLARRDSICICYALLLNLNIIDEFLSTRKLLRKCLNNTRHVTIPSLSILKFYHRTSKFLIKTDMFKAKIDKISSPLFG